MRLRNNGWRVCRFAFAKLRISAMIKMSQPKIAQAGPSRERYKMKLPFVQTTSEKLRAFERINAKPSSQNIQKPTQIHHVSFFKKACRATINTAINVNEI